MNVLNRTVVSLALAASLAAFGSGLRISTASGAAVTDATF